MPKRHQRTTTNRRDLALTLPTLLRRITDTEMVVNKGESPWIEAPKSRTIRRNSSYDEDSESGKEHNDSVEVGLSFFDSFREETPTAKSLTNRSASFDGSTGTNSSEIAINNAVSGALVGENVLDSPSSRRRTRKVAEASITPPRAGTQSSSSAEAMSLSTGLMAQGLSWIRTQREERRRRYLQHQAEEQASKIREAQLAGIKTGMANSSASTSASHGLGGNSTFKNIANAFTGNLSSTVADDGIRRTESSDENEKENGSVESGDEIIQKTGVSCSGNGYVVEFAVPDTKSEDSDWVPPVRIEAEENISSAPFILDAAQRQLIAQRVLPSGIVYAKWKRLYSLTRDGDSFENCLRVIAGHTKTLLVLRTSANEIMGGFADMAWDQPAMGGHQYFGGPTSSIFSFAARLKSVNTVTRGESENYLNVYKWTGKNRYIQLCDIPHKMLAFGGGGHDGAFGLSVAHDFQHGSSGPCDTFDNQPLSQSSTSFNIVEMEIYCFLLGQF